METILITGGSGLIGSALGKLLVSRGYEVIILSRKIQPSVSRVSYAVWDIKKPFMDSKAVEKADHIIHLAGAGVGDKRWTKKRKAEIVKSRVEGAALIIKTLRSTPNKVQTVVSASGIGCYGHDRPLQKKETRKGFVETDPLAKDFLGETCRLWEESIKPVMDMGKRLVILRTGIVLSNDGGAFPEFVRPMKAGVAAILGSGKQMISWIHIDDVARMYLFAIENKNTSGTYNAVAPDPVTNKAFVLRAAKARRRPFIAVHAPEFALKLMLGEMSVEVLKSSTVDSEKVREAGFKFLHPSLDSALGVLSQNL